MTLDIIPTEVSIHAPLRGATAGSRADSTPQTVSIHAPLRGATQGPCMKMMMTMMFQSTHPCGVRRGGGVNTGGRRMVSIHAPLRGATANDIVFAIRSAVSIHAPLRGATVCLEGCVLHLRVSIHAPLRGATDGARATWQCCDGFNPRTPAGCDGTHPSSSPTGPRFQSTHPCGVRLRWIGYTQPQIGVSIHAPLRGATCMS